MSTGALDPLIHDPERLRIIATLATLPENLGPGDNRDWRQSCLGLRFALDPFFNALTRGLAVRDAEVAH
jgi:hypothetical protein